MLWIDRDITGKILKAAESRPALLLTGIRQAGKSSLLKRLFDEDEYVTLDRIALAEEAEENPSSFLNRFHERVIIDEIQYAPSLFRDLKIRIDEERETKGKWLLTGSQQFSLMKGVSESLAGRVRILHLLPLSASELSRTTLIKDSSELLWKGGFPEIWAQGLDASEFYEDYIQTYLERDLRLSIQITKLRDFRRFLSLLALRAGQLLNYSEISKETGTAVNTIKSWTNVLESSGIVYLLPPYYNNLGKRLIKAPKVYFCDTGLLSSLLNIHSAEALERSPQLGNIWEDFVFTEYLKSGFTPGKDLFFYRDQNGVEVDFIAEKDGRSYLIEAKNSERPKPDKLNFNKIAPLFKHDVRCILACRTMEKGILMHKDYAVLNPLFGGKLLH